MTTLKKPAPLSYHKNTMLHQTYFKHKNGLMDIVMVFIRESYLIVFATFQRLLSPAADGNVFLTHTNNSASDGILNKNVNCCPALCLGAVTCENCDSSRTATPWLLTNSIREQSHSPQAQRQQLLLGPQQFPNLKTGTTQETPLKVKKNVCHQLPGLFLGFRSHSNYTELVLKRTND